MKSKAKGEKVNDEFLQKNAFIFLQDGAFNFKIVKIFSWTTALTQKEGKSGTCIQEWLSVTVWILMQIQMQIKIV